MLRLRDGLLPLLLAGCAGDDAPLASPGSMLEARTLELPADASDVAAWDALPPDTLSITLLATSGGDDLLAFGVRDGGGRDWVDPLRPEFSPNRMLRGRGVAAGMIPVSSAALPLATDYRVRAARDRAAPPASTPISLSVWLKRSAGGTGAVPEAQELAVVLCFAGGAPGEGRLAAALGEVRRVWRAAGIEIVENGRLALDDAVGKQLARVRIDPALGSDSPDLAALLRLSDRAPGQGLAVFFVTGLETPDGHLPSLAGGIPVPPVPGTRRSGLAIERTLVESDPGRAGVVLAHEIGHALGLFHTTEPAFLPRTPGGPRLPVHDQLDDTPECPAEADRSADGQLDAGECAAFDAGNLMFWATGRAATALTPEQAAVARRSALAR